jgi:DNA-binding beta-propeller fold protein YncE
MRSRLLLVLALLLTGNPLQAAQEKRLLYVVAPGIRDYLAFGGAGILVFDIDKGHAFVERIATTASAEPKPANIKGVCVSAETGKLYFTTPKKLYAVDLHTKKTLWDRALPEGCDRMAITPDGKALYVPSFEKDTWNVVDADGKLVRTITTKSGAHNTVCGLDGKRVYLGGLKSNLLFIADTSSHKVTQCGPFSGAVRPFTINGAQTLCFVCVNGLLGFEVGDLTTGKKLHRVEVTGYEPGKVKRHGCPSHGIGLTPDEKEVWVCDAANSRLHVFDVTTMPPKQVARIALREQPGWVTFSLDGKFAYPSTGEVIDTKTRKIVTALKDETGRPVHSEKMVEIHFANGKAVRAGDQFGVGRVVPTKGTTLSNPAQRYRVVDKPYTILRRAGIEAVIVDNQAVDDAVLPKHRAGYSGVAALRGAGRKENFFVPAVAGLNFEHIHDGTVQATKVLYEPRHAPMQLRLIDDHTAELYQAPTPHFGLESCQRYHLLEDGTIELTIDCIPRRKTFRNGTIGLFWASYINQPKSGAIHFKGHVVGEKVEKTRWIESVSPMHGTDPTHPAWDDDRVFAHDKAFPLSLAFNLSKVRYREPWYYGVNGDDAFVQMFRPADRVRLTQSPSGGGKGNPAWDFQFYIPDYEVGKRYRMVMRAKLVQFTSRDQLERDTAKHRRDLGR